jgi:VCBS repeat-containing protein
MLVASGVEHRSEAMAAVVPLSQVIGNIQTAIGLGTLSRAGSIAVEVAVGDPVCQGDVIETAADGRIGIRLIDGTVFNISSDARVELREFVSDSNGTSLSTLLAVTRGTFAFIAGQAAKSGSFGIDTPLGSIRAGARAGGFGMLSLTALTFATMSEVRAADPDVALLDDDSITYKDLEHGVFELTTKEAIPRHIIVEDPGQTVVLSKIGSSMSVAQVGNSAARMEELQAAQQDVFANLAKELGPNGSSTPPFVESLPLEPINFTESDAPALQHSLPPVLPGVILVPEVILVRPPPTLNVQGGPVELDTVVFDTFTATSGTFSASSAIGGAPLTFGISGGIAGNTVLSGVTYDVSKGSPYGTLYVNSASGAYTFVPDSGAINALTAPTTDNFVITVSDGNLSTSQTFTITIDGVNDAAFISGAATGSSTEGGGVANAVPGAPIATGTLTDTDVDNPPNTFAAVSSKASTGGYGTFTMTAAGVWTYTLDNTNAKVQALNVGDVLTDTFTVTTVDGTPRVVTITIHGANDAAIISGDTTGSVTEATACKPATPIATGTLTDTDVDNTPNAFTAVCSPKASTGGYGTFTIAADGVWTYKLDNNNCTVQALNVGDKLTDTFTVTTIDGTPQVVTVTINGANDPAIICGDTTGCVTEAAGCKPGMPVATGRLTDTDVDNPPNSFTAVCSPKASTGGYGTFTMTAAGVWTYTLDNTNSAVQALNVCDKLTDTFTVTTIDGTPQVVTITINGANDPAIICGTTTGSVTEPDCKAPGAPIATGTLTDTDVDNPPNTFTAVCAPKCSAHGYGTFTMTAAGVWTYMLDQDNCTVQALKACDTLTDTFTVTTIDGTAQVVTITIHGAGFQDFDHSATATQADAPPIDGTSKADATAGGDDGSQMLQAAFSPDAVSSTGPSDVVQESAGAPTTTAEDGANAVQGDSGHGTIDTSVEGFWAEHLGNGDDRFVYASAADHHAARFDIPDFKSGSDRIDLTALGALAFVVLALDSTSTSVPAHTIAWLYDSTANQTTIYVNPTDQILSVGATSLLEIHLEGVASIQPSDFALASAAAAAASEPIDPGLVAMSDNDATAVTPTAAVSSGQAVNDGTVAVDGNKAVQTAEAGCFRFDAGRDHIEPMAAGSELQVVDHKQIPDGGDRLASPHGDWSIHSGTSTCVTSDNVNHIVSTQKQAASEGAPHTGTIDIGLNVVLHSAVPTAPTSDDDNQSASGGASKPGIASIRGAGADDLESCALPHSSFGSRPAAALGLEDSFHFKQELPNSKGSEINDITELALHPSSTHHGANAAEHHRPHGAQAVELVAPAHDSADALHAASGHEAIAHAAHLHYLIV